MYWRALTMNKSWKNKTWSELTSKEKEEFAKLLQETIVKKAGYDQVDKSRRMIGYMIEAVDDLPHVYGFNEQDTIKEIFSKRISKEPLKELTVLGRHFETKNIAPIFPEAEKIINRQRNQEIAKRKKGHEGPLKKTIRLLGEKENKPSFETVLLKIKEIEQSEQDDEHGPLYPVIIEGIESDDEKVDYYNRVGGPMKTVTF